MFSGKALSVVEEDQQHLAKIIDKCYNNFSNYQIQAGIDMITMAQHLLHQETYLFWTDGKRILAYDTGRTQEERNREAVQLLKKIADMEIDDYPLANPKFICTNDC